MRLLDKNYRYWNKNTKLNYLKKKFYLNFVCMVILFICFLFVSFVYLEEVSGEFFINLEYPGDFYDGEHIPEMVYDGLSVRQVNHTQNILNSIEPVFFMELRK